MQPAVEPELVEQAWRELWDTIEFLRLLASRPEEWESRFTTGIPGLLTPGERLSLPGEAERALWVSADATLELYGAVDWSAGICTRRSVGPDFEAMGQQLGETQPDLIISYAELMAFVAFATLRGPDWRGRLILFATDNSNVEAWIRKWGPRPRAARYLIRVLRYLQAKFGFEVVVAYVRTYHNVTADLITRTDDAGYDRMCQKKKFRHVDVGGAWDEMVQKAPATAGVVALFHLDAEDANIATQLRAKRASRLQEDRSLPELPRLIEVNGQLGQW